MKNLFKSGHFLTKDISCNFMLISVNLILIEFIYIWKKKSVNTVRKPSTTSSHTTTCITHEKRNGTGSNTSVVDFAPNNLTLPCPFSRTNINTKSDVAASTVKLP